MLTKEILEKYYAGVAKKSEWQSFISDDLKFTGTGLRSTTGKDAYVQVNTNFLRSVKASKVKDIIVEGNRACAVVSYDMVSPKGKNTSFDVAEILTVKNEKIDSSDIFFDTVGFRDFMAN